MAENTEASQARQGNYREKRTDELALNNLYVPGSMPEEDPFAQDAESDVIDPVKKKPLVAVARDSYSLNRKASEGDVQALSVWLSSKSIALDIEHLDRKGKKIKSMTWRMEIKEGHVLKTCSYTTTDFSKLDFSVLLDEAGDAIGIEVFVSKKLEQRVISCMATE
jgi:hypothetical protein